MNFEQKYIRRLFGLDDEDFVAAAYEIFLGRTADPGGSRNFMEALRRGEGRVAVLRQIASSEEAANKARDVPAVLLDVMERGVYLGIVDELLALDDVAFLAFAYRLIFDREADPDGKAVYLRAMRKGAPRPEILMDLRTSPEGRRAARKIPGLDKAIRRFKWLKFPVLGSLLRKVGFAREPGGVPRALYRVEAKLARFRTSALGREISTQVGSAAALLGSPPEGEWSAAIKMAVESEKITGNVALPGKVMVEGVQVNDILILKLDHMGDFFISVRPMVMLKEAFPGARLTLVCGPWNVSLAERLGIFDRIVPYNFFAPKTGDEEFNWEARDWIARCDGVRDLKLGSFDFAIDLRHDTDTRPCLTRIDTKYRIGFASPGGPLPATPPLDLSLLEVPPEHREQLHAESRLVALASLVIETFRPPVEHPIRKLLGDGERKIRPFDDEKPYVVLAPGAGSPNRTWDADNFVELAGRVIDELGVGIVITGGPSEVIVNTGIAEKLDPANCLDLTGASLLELPQILDRAALYVGNDTGGGHLAAMLGTPTLSVYGGVSDPRVWQPIGPRVSITHSKTPCSYCHINLRKDCKYEVRCMTEITVDDVFDELLNLYQRYVLLLPEAVKQAERVTS